MRPQIIVFASGTRTGGGSGFENLVRHSRNGDLNADIAGVVCNMACGGVQQRAARLGVKFVYLGNEVHSAEYFVALPKILEVKNPWYALSGWLRKVEGLDPARTFNIHPALLSIGSRHFGGLGMYGHHVHEAVCDAFKKGEIDSSGFSMHFVTPKYDEGPVFAEVRVPLEQGMTADDIAKVVNKAEHQWQPYITNLVVHGSIHLEGKRVIVPENYPFLPWK